MENAKLQGRKWADDSEVDECLSCHKGFNLTVLNQFLFNLISNLDIYKSIFSGEEASLSELRANILQRVFR